MPLLPSIKFDTSTLPVEIRFAEWRKALPDYDVSLPPDTSAEDFYARAEAWFLGDLMVTVSEISGASFCRDDDRVKTDGLDSVSLLLLTEGRWHGWAGDRDLDVSAGQLVALDVSQPLLIDAPRSKSIWISIGRSSLQDSVGPDISLHGHLFEGAAGALLVDHILALMRHLPDLREKDAVAIRRATLAQIAAAVSVVPILQPGDPGILRTRHKVRRYIDRHLTAQNLSPDALSRELEIARTTLYRSFESLGGIASYIQQRRLDAVRKLLLHPGEERSISELAHTFGFVSASHFTTAFRRAFGCSPREMRNDHRDATGKAFSAPDGTERYVEWQDQIRRR